MRRLITATLLLLYAATCSIAATFVVTKTSDSNDGVCDSDCSFREAVVAANAAATDDVVEFDGMVFATPQTVLITLGEVVIANNGTLTINGTGASKLTFDGNGTSRIISTGANVVATINDAKFTHGNGAGALNTGRAGAIYNVGGTLTLNNLVVTGNTASNGGGLNNASSSSPSVPGTLTLNNCVVSNNTTTSSGGGMQNFSTSTLTINNSTIMNNTSGGTTGGGGIQANGNVRITNSTFTGNNAPGGSGGALVYNGVTLLVTNSTIVGNTSTNNGGGIHKSTSNLTGVIRNSMIANNNGTVGSEDVTGIFSSEGNNLIETVGTSSGWVGSDITGQDPILSPLGFYGGLGVTYVPLSGSPALGAGQACVLDSTCSANNPPINVNVDQRGAARPANPPASAGANVDIGAVEASPSYVASLPDATFGVPYDFTLASGFTGFTFLLNSGDLGGITLTSAATSATLGGTPNQSGTRNAVVQVSDGTHSTLVNYSVNVNAGATVIVRGVVVDSLGSPVKRARVTMTDGGMNTYSATTNQLGRFFIEGIPNGSSLLVNTTSKGLNFPASNVDATQPVNVITLTATNANRTFKTR
ncbi:MAG TPA: carboxypeptidase-like regulatory domain-containing protein [Pyrinomonadaceae bacterium]|nr:carboxypeptidase-like regulatory domain-containing protein [Pyrinomonadaceae bacterium]